MPDPVILEEIPQGGDSWTGNGPAFTRQFTVIATNPANVREVLDTQLGIRRGVQYQSANGNIPDPYAVCLDIQAHTLTQTPTTGTGLFRAYVLYGYPSTRTRRRPAIPNGVPRWRMEAALVYKSVETDSDGRPIDNSADEPFFPLVQFPFPKEILVAELVRYGTNELSVYAEYRPYIGKLNFNTYAGAPRRCLLFHPPTIDELDTPGLTALQSIFRVTFRFEFQEEVRVRPGGGPIQTFPGWDATLKNKGRRVRGTGAGSHLMYQLHDGPNPFDTSRPLLTDPVFLNAAGTDVSATPTFRTFQIGDEIDFSGALPNP